MLTDEISHRIKRAVENNNVIRDAELEQKLEAQRVKFEIVEAGYIAELTENEKTIADVVNLRNKVMDLYYRTEKRIKEIAMIIAENEHAGIKIIENVSDNIGELERISLRVKKIDKEIEKNKIKDEEALRI
jgi:cysteinyl-tRNA synthetase